MIKDGLELLRKYGARDLFFITSIIFLYSTTLKQEKKIDSIEARLYDCYEDKFQMNRSVQNPTKNNYPLLAILPNEKNNIRHARTKRNF